MRRRQKFQPVCVYDSMGFIRILRIAAEQIGDTVSLLVRDTTKDYLWTTQVGEGQIAQFGNPARYIVAECDLKREVATYKDLALRYGATPEAVRLLGLLCPVSKQEEATMAEKLKAKSPKAADKEALKAAAKEAPVGGKKATAKADAAPAEKPANRKGNPEALAKAREARGKDMEAERKKKITLVEKNNPKREGSRAFEIYAKYKTCKTVGQFLDAGGTMADIRYDSQKGFIQVG